MMKNKLFKRGMSLLEVSIVLGVMGTIAGGIWAIAGGVRDATRSTMLMQQTQLLVKNTRDYYSLRALPTATTAITSTLIAAKLVPEDMCPASGCTTVKNSYGGTVTVAPAGTSPYNYVDVTLGSVEKRGCVQMMMNLGAKASEYGVTSMTINAGTARTTFPVSDANVNSDCSSATSNSMVLRFLIRM